MIRVVDKLLLFLYSIVIGIISVVFACVGFAWINESLSIDFIETLYSNSNYLIALAIVGIVLFLISLRFFVVSLSRSTVSSQSVDQRTEYGDIRISIETMENLALKAAMKIRGVKDLKARVKATDTGMDIVLRTVVDGEVSIPQLTEEIQISVKNYLEEITGIPVTNVSVYIANIIQTNTIKSRVE
ncbi:alkaline shock response membrane anchor protein AmaP [Paenibacillus endoradicis]|uniref:alkaline shock response membrane anchor protein AmaP n=1 Tax=Paenibacillus endoradicis TaxID=2972487 RepID=UPI002159A327|nr:alkaline shock response membrane anchor protein AmaP [Paenibacillus endoradicis]MCR8659291.1 alkaline shock response membrane anchor protein AmaP [Paenibacillus endoradicis]